MIKNLLLKKKLILRKQDNVIFDTQKNIIIECNEIGYEILTHFQNVNNLDNVVNIMCNEYDAPIEEIRSEVEIFINKSLQDEILEIVI